MPPSPSPKAVAGNSTVGVPGWLLSFVAGYVDVVGFAALFGLFTAHVTGNFIMIGVQMIGTSEGLLAKLLALPTFVVAVAGTRLVEVALQRRNSDPVTVLILAECVLLAGFMAIGLEASPIPDPGAPIVVICGLLAVAAMGIQNTLSRTALADAGPTTIMTGNTTQIVIDAVDYAGATGEARSAIRKRLGKMLPAVLGFATGAIAGALALANWSFWSMSLPIALLLMLTIRRAGAFARRTI
ncbi:YoaK family protein [Cupriavidus pauculus]|uniref:YoaK family protein n=1 Tax=Cupriavidus pauculus TaxID=82633 RepID=UPI001EE3927F|nr:YoaK family protein [Cupriavidus pauculus]GJG94096.1 DUF1275 domain-containing protein [Cupriavidus pauculus]